MGSIKSIEAIEACFSSLFTTGTPDCSVDDLIETRNQRYIANNTWAQCMIALLLGQGYINGGKVQQAEPELRLALGLLTKAGLTEYEPFVRTTLGHALKSLGRTDDAFVELTLARSMGRSDSAGYIRVLSNLAGFYSEHGEIQKAIEFFRECLEAAKQKDNYRSVVSTLNELSGLYLLLENFSQALEYSEEATRESQKAGDARWTCFSRVRETTALLELRRYEEVLTILDEVDEKIHRFGAQHLLGTAAVVRAKASRLMKRYDESRSAFENAISIFRQLENSRLLGNALVLTSELDIDTDAFDHAEQLLEEALSLATAQNEPNALSSSYEAYTNLYSKKRDFEKAFDYLQRYNEAKKKVVDSEGERRSELFRIELEVEKKEKEMDVYKIKGELVQQQLGNTTLQLLAQAEMLSDLRTDLLKIARKMPPTEPAARELRERVKTLPCQSIDWEKFDTQFKAAHPEFVKKLLDRFPELTPMETRVCTLLRLNLKSHEIAKMFCLEERSIETHRFNIRRKLKIETKQSLSNFLNAL